MSSTPVKEVDELEQDVHDAEEELELSDKDLILQNFHGIVEAVELLAFLFCLSLWSHLCPHSVVSGLSFEVLCYGMFSCLSVCL